MLGVQRQARRERKPARRGRLAQALDLGPGRLGVDVVDGDGRDASPVVDSGVEEQRKVVVGEVRRRLHVPVGAQHDPCRGHAPELLFERRVGMSCHARSRLGTKVLHDHLAQVAVLVAQLFQREQRLEALRTRLADPDQDPTRERDRELAGEADRLEPRGRRLVGRRPVRPALLRQPVGDRLDHDSHRSRHRAEQLQLAAAHHARVEVGQ